MICVLAKGLDGFKMNARVAENDEAAAKLAEFKAHPQSVRVETYDADSLDVISMEVLRFGNWEACD